MYTISAPTSRKSWPQRLAELATALVAVGALCVVIGAVLRAILFERARVPIIEGLSAIPRESFVIVGAVNLLLPALVYATFTAGTVWFAERQIASTADSTVDRWLERRRQKRWKPVVAKSNESKERLETLTAAIRDGTIDDAAAEAEMTAIEALTEKAHDAIEAARTAEKTAPERTNRATFRIQLTTAVVGCLIVPFGVTPFVMFGYIVGTAFWQRRHGMMPWRVAGAVALIGAATYVLALEADDRQGLRPVTVITTDRPVSGGLVANSAEGVYVSTGRGKLVAIPARSVSRVEIGALHQSHRRPTGGELLRLVGL